ncbi:helix-turn-helix transcriptional regulator [Streptomyces sp. NPDC001985]|uniref:helix-turn-helix transcriptional regulator n=1 Tax=Streptomyces sp. NPDC001985 TaxID=3154406 RepID=UPI00331E2A6F
MAGGRGGSILIEGEPGIGKTALLHRAARDAERAGCRALTVAATGGRGPRVPLGPVLDGLARHRPAHPAHCARIAALAALLRHPAPLGPDTPSPPALVDRLTALIHRITGDAPLALLLDDLHHADGATLLLWQRLSRATGRIPLLLTATVRHTPRHHRPHRLRRDLLDRGTTLLALGPLSAGDITDLATEVTGAAPGPALRRRLALAGGHPGYARELLDSWRPDSTGTAQDPGPPPIPRAVARRLDTLPATTLDILHAVALFPAGCTGAELAAVTGTDPFALLETVDDTIADGTLTDAGERLRFQQEIVRLGLNARVPGPLLARRHGAAARALAAAGAPVARVAGQLLPAGPRTDGWAIGWTTAAAAELAGSDPEAAVELLRRCLAALPPEDTRRAPLRRHLTDAVLLLRGARHTGVLRELLTETTDPDTRAQLLVHLVQELLRAGDWDAALTALDRPQDPDPAPMAPEWAETLRGLRALAHHRAGHHDRAAALARQLLSGPGRTAPALGEVYGRHTLACVLLRARHTRAALAENTRALHTLGRIGARRTSTRWMARNHTDVGIGILTHQAVLLDLADRPQDALRALDEAREDASEQRMTGQLGQIAAIAAVLNYWQGHWDTALAELERPTGSPAAPSLPALGHGVAALIHGHRDHGPGARAHYGALHDGPGPTGPRRDPCGYRLMAGALLAERDGRPRDALAILRPTLDPAYAHDLDQRHQWLPDIVRLALETGDRPTARAATALCRSEAEREPHAGRTAAARRCRGLVDQDIGPLLAAVDHYRETQRPLHLGRALEDTASVTAALGDPTAARGLLEQALERYRELGAAWDIRRATARLRTLGVRTGPRTVRRKRPRTGWAALTPAELRVARLVAAGHSNPQIAGELFLSPRTVQSHVSSILGKLGVRSRTEVARSAAEGTAHRPPAREAP